VRSDTVSTRHAESPFYCLVTPHEIAKRAFSFRRYYGASGVTSVYFWGDDGEGESFNAAWLVSKPSTTSAVSASAAAALGMEGDEGPGVDG